MVTVILGILITGEGNSLQEIIGSSNSLLALMLGGFLGSIASVILSLFNSSMSL